MHQTTEPPIHRTIEPTIHRAFKPESDVASDINVQNTVRSDVTGDLVYSAPAAPMRRHNKHKIVRCSQEQFGKSFFGFPNQMTKREIQKIRIWIS